MKQTEKQKVGWYIFDLSYIMNFFYYEMPL
jgi:hypothetical protein